MENYELISKMKEIGIDLKYIRKGNFSFYISDEVIIVHNEKRGETNVWFHVSVLPNRAAWITQYLIEYCGLRNIIIEDVFLINNKEFVHGDRSIEMYDEYKKETAIHDFITEQKQLFILQNYIPTVEC